MKKKLTYYPLLVSLLFLTLSGCLPETNHAAAKQEIELNVFVAASLKNAMSEIQTNYRKTHPNVEILLNAESSGTLQTQIEEGAICDLFFSASNKQMDALNEKKLLLTDTLIELLENQVVLITAKESDTKVLGFDTITLAANLALASEDVPIGQYAREIFTSLGKYNEVMAMEINEGANVTAVLSAVSEKSNEVGVVYATDAAYMKDSVRIIDTAPVGSMKQAAIYPVAQVVNQEADEAQLSATTDFLDYLKSMEAAKIFESYGFTIND